ncbi:hypothetical protein FIBSPDRAFT_898059 [Athelia psychrophila]|uniref:Uncharacterized protein n=1 Tax=Athelia psychrophila TaxID=1759441 RepID=A0A166BDY0_9AGAM|nr:hypothetical protein FIBSPDRAFT_898059 [Fibularhizoctonia sp. CBS 109695]
MTVAVNSSLKIILTPDAFTLDDGTQVIGVVEGMVPDLPMTGKEEEPVMSQTSLKLVTSCPPPRATIASIHSHSFYFFHIPWSSGTFHESLDHDVIHLSILIKQAAAELMDLLPVNTSRVDHIGCCINHISYGPLPDPFEGIHTSSNTRYSYQPQWLLGLTHPTNVNFITAIQVWLLRLLRNNWLYSPPGHIKSALSEQDGYTFGDL